MATIRIKKEIANVSFEKDNGELHTLSGFDVLQTSGDGMVVLIENHKDFRFSPSDTIYINDALFTGTAKQIVAKLRDEVFLKANSSTGGSGDAIVKSPSSPTAVSLIWAGNQAQYDAIVTKNANTLYFIQ